MAMEMAIAKSAGGKLKLHTKRETLLNKSESASKFRNHLLSPGQKHTKKRTTRTTTTATTTWRKKTTHEHAGPLCNWRLPIFVGCGGDAI